MFAKYRNIAVVSISTVGSRILGLIRDVMIFAALGTSVWNSAFILAFTLPNLFRRLLGEGALTSAVVPVFSDVLQKQGRELAFDFFNQVLLRVSVILLATVSGGIVALACLNSFGFVGGRWVLGADLSVFLLPYMFFICLAAVVSAGLNVMGRFAAAALTPILLNSAMIAVLAAGWLLQKDQKEIVYLLCGGVLFGGVLQLAVPALDLMRQGWRPKFSTESSDAMEQVWALFIPGLLGAAILQINILVSRLLAFTLDESSVSVLYLASRLMELPLGVFSIAVVTVFFPLLATAASGKDRAAFAEAFSQGLRLIFAISVPAGIGLFLLAEPILEVLFNWGNFSATDVSATVPLLAIYAIGLPFYSIATFATRALHARKDMISPVRAAFLCLVVNAVLGYFLMQFYGAAGLALGNVLAAVLQSIILLHSICRAREVIILQKLGIPILKILAAALCMTAAVIGVQFGLSLFNFEMEKMFGALLLACGIVFGALVYFGALAATKFDDLQELKEIILRRRTPKHMGSSDSRSGGN